MLRASLKIRTSAGGRERVTTTIQAWLCACIGSAPAARVRPPAASATLLETPASEHQRRTAGAHSTQICYDEGCRAPLKCRDKYACMLGTRYSRSRASHPLVGPPPRLSAALLCACPLPCAARTRQLHLMRSPRHAAFEDRNASCTIVRTETRASRSFNPPHPLASSADREHRA